MTSRFWTSGANGLLPNFGRSGGGGGGEPPITLGATTGDLGANYNANFMQGKAVQATENGTLYYLNFKGAADEATANNFRGVIYAATSATAWGAKLAETAQQTGMGINETKKVALNTPVTIVAGNWYALCIHPGGGSTRLLRIGGQNGRFFSDNYADGSADPAGATSDLGGSSAPVIWGTTE